MNNTKHRTENQTQSQTFMQFKTINHYWKVIVALRYFNKPSNNLVIKIEIRWNNFRKISLHCNVHLPFGLPGIIIKSIFLINKLLFSIEIFSSFIPKTYLGWGSKNHHSSALSLSLVSPLQTFNCCSDSFQSPVLMRFP